MRVAIPVAGGQLAMHFGYTEAFALMDVDDDASAVAHRETISAPPHAPGVLPRWLGEHGVDVVIVCGMGRRARDLLARGGIEVVAGAPVGDPEQIALSYAAGTLETGDNVCDH